MMKIKFFDKINNLKLGKKMLLAFTIGAILPIVLIQIISYQLTNHYLTKKVDELMLINLTQMSERTNLTLDSYRNLLYQIYIDEDISNHISWIIENKEKGKAAAYSQIIDRLKQYNIAGKGLRSISIICADGNTVTYDYKTGSLLENLWSNTMDMRSTSAYKNTIEQSGMVITPTEVFREKGEETYVFHISKRIYDLENLGKGTIATVVMSIDASVLSDICKTEIDTETDEEYGISFLLSEDRKIISYPEEMYMGITLKEDIDIPYFVGLGEKLENKEIAINSYHDVKTNWTFYYAYDKKYMLKEVSKIQQTFIGVAILAVSIAVLIIIYFVKKILRSIFDLIEGMNHVKMGNLDVILPKDSNDEIGQIADNFNEMIREVKLLISQVKVATDKQKNAEIKALEAQINPHFLYNTIDSINWMAIEKGEYEISNMLRNLGVILRYSVSNCNQKVTVDEMGDWLEKYISLQQVRFNFVFESNIRIQDNIRQKKIYKLLVQPFIENAILHGFEGIEGGGILRVDIMQEERVTDKNERICILIEDNGVGMSKEMVDLYNNRAVAISEKEGHIGLHNAFARMEMYYGERAEWRITSYKGIGTVISLRIPVCE